MSREKTVEEVREEFLAHVKVLIEVWNKNDMSKEECLSGLAFSILSTIDGSSMALPAFILAPLPHESDKEYHMEDDENYYAENHNSNVKCDISGYLHELFYK